MFMTLDKIESSPESSSISEKIYFYSYVRNLFWFTVLYKYQVLSYEKVILIQYITLKHVIIAL